MLTQLSALLEGASPVANAVRMIRTLDLDRIPELLGNILLAARASNKGHPQHDELDLAVDTARLSEGVWDRQFSQLDLCIAYVAFLKLLSISVGLRSDMVRAACMLCCSRL
jgi:hypothetical protein